MSLLSQVASLCVNNNLKDQLCRHGLNISYVQWEDCARDNNSSLGPNISDITLNVQGQSFPIIRPNNFTDLTFDLSIERFQVNVGNEIIDKNLIKPSYEELNKNQFCRLSFTEYLQNIEKYINCKCNNGLFLERDKFILTSTQTCILPLENNKVEFNVEIKNYQYSREDPSVLCIVVSPHGTSAQVLNKRNQKIFFNNQGSSAFYCAERLKDKRQRDGCPLDGPMNQTEKEENALFIFQIPLKHNNKICCLKTQNSYGRQVIDDMLTTYTSSLNDVLENCEREHFTFKEENCSDQKISKFEQKKQKIQKKEFKPEVCFEKKNDDDNDNKNSDAEEVLDFGKRKKKCRQTLNNELNENIEYLTNIETKGPKRINNIHVEIKKVKTRENKITQSPTILNQLNKKGFDQGQLSVGENNGPWNGTHCCYKIERDENYPIRCTIQYYRVTDSVDISDDIIQDISKQIWKLYDETPQELKGSLVNNKNTDRITKSEPLQKIKQSFIPINQETPFFDF